jgi:thiol-disulfide isomerase/thioredoxin
VPDLAMLMASNPVATLVDSNVLNMRGDGDALVVDTPDGEYRLNIDPETHLISSLVFAPQLSEVHVQQDLSLQVRFTNRIKNHNKPIDPKRFTFDAKDSKGYPTLLEASMRARQQASSRSRIIGRSAPSVVLKSIDGDEVDLSKVKADMVILDFWATWCGPCVGGLQSLERVQAWAHKEKQSVAIYTINNEDTVANIKKFWSKHGLTLPALMDPNLVAGVKYGHLGEEGTGTLPYSVYIHKGKIVDFTEGVRGDMDPAEYVISKVKKYLEN